MENVLEFFKSLRETFPFLFEYVANSLVAFIIALAVVYLFGRMIGIVKSDRAKNMLAFIVIGIVSWFMAFVKYEFVIPTDINFWFFIFDISCYVAGGILAYVLIGFKLYARIDHLMDKKIADDETLTPKSKKTKRKK